MGNYALGASHRNPLDTQVTAFRGNALCGRPCEASASSMGIRAVRSDRRAGNREKVRLHIRISAMGPRSLLGQPGGDARTYRSSNLCDGASVDIAGNRGVDVGFRA